MLTASLSAILEDLKSGKEVSVRLKKAVASGSKDVSAEQQLKLITSVLDYVTKSPSEEAHRAFQEAIRALRNRVPSLKSNGKSPIDVIAGVEKYSINYALSLLSGVPQQSSSFCPIGTLDETLRLIFEARLKSAKIPVKTVKGRRKGIARSSKENKDPLSPSCERDHLDEDVLNWLPFPSTSKEQFSCVLPKGDSATVAAIVVGALVIRMTACNTWTSLTEICLVAKQIVVPWLDFLHTFPDQGSQRTHSSYLKKVNHFLFDMCRKWKNDLGAVLQTRAYALTLAEIKLTQYARELLQSVNNFKREIMLSKSNIPATPIIIEVYEDALRFVTKYNSNDPSWVSESVSVWMDNIALVWSQRQPMPLPLVFYKRVSCLKKTHTNHTMLKCYSLQIGLYEIGAYQEDISIQKNSKASRHSAGLWDKVNVLLDEFKVPDFSSPAAACSTTMSGKCEMSRLEKEEEGSKGLRLLRILEPLRCAVIAIPKRNTGLLGGAEHVLRTYVFTLSKTFLVLKTIPTSTTGDPSIGELFSRLQKMFGAAIEAARELLRSYWYQSRTTPMRCLLKHIVFLIQTHGKYSAEAAFRWRDWIFTGLLSWFEIRLKMSLKEQKKNKKTTLSLLADLAQSYAEDISLCYQHREDSCSKGLGLLKVARACYSSIGEWERVAEMSVKILLVQGGQLSESRRFEDSLDFEAVQTAVLDLSRAAKKENGLNFLSTYEFPGEYLLLLFLEYSCWARLNSSQFKSHESYTDLVYGLQLGRCTIFRTFEDVECVCPVRIFHEFWISYVVEESPAERGSVVLPEFPSDRICPGHSNSGIFGSDEGESVCSSPRISFLNCITRLWKATNAREFSSIKEQTDLLLSMLQSHENALKCTELMVISSEVLQWSSVVLALSNYGNISNEVQKLSESCCLLLDISEVRDFFNHPWAELCEELTDGESLSHTMSVEETQAVPYNISFPKDLTCNRIVMALSSANASLKESLRFILNFKSESSRILTKYPCNIAGVVIDLAFNICTETGQLFFLKLFKLIENLYQYARLLLDAENLRDGRYYMERCHFVASHCLFQSNHSFCSLSAIYYATCLSDKNMRFETVRKLVDLGKQVSIPGENPLSELKMLCHIANAMSDIVSSRYGPKVDLSPHFNIDELYERYEGLLELIMSKNLKSEYEKARIHLILSKAVLHAFAGERMTAINSLKRLVETASFREHEMKALALYYLSRNMFLSIGTLDLCLRSSSLPLSDVGTKPTSRRVTRSQMKRTPSEVQGVTIATLIEEAKGALHQAELEISLKKSKPWTCRQILSLMGMISSESEMAVPRLAVSIGSSFNIRWGYCIRDLAIRQSKNSYSRDATEPDELNQDLESLSISPHNVLDKEIDIRLLRRRLNESKCVLVGLNIDGEDRSTLIIWRICPMGSCSKRLTIPKTGPTSYEGILDRIEGVIAEMKETAVKEGQVMSRREKKEWWDSRYRLDKQIEKIVFDVENEWLSDVSLLLIPSIRRCGNPFFESTRQEKKTGLLSFLQLSQVAFDSAVGNVVCDTTGEDGDVFAGQLVLMIDTALECIPWESLPLLRMAQVSATRTPSVSFLNHHLKNVCRPIDGGSLLYVINPAGDLGRTEDRFQKILGFEDEEGSVSLHGWKGFFGKTSPEQISKLFSGEEVYLYCGHGTGETYFSPSVVCRRNQAPVALLMGCSSARPENSGLGSLESNGTAIEFLIHGSRAVVGNLWDVSDGEIDRFTNSLMSLWLGLNSGEERGRKHLNLSEAVAESRSVCRLPYLVGAATIVMGAPNIEASSPGTL